jgi:hypothetical protein
MSKALIAAAFWLEFFCLVFSAMVNLKCCEIGEPFLALAGGRTNRQTDCYFYDHPPQQVSIFHRKGASLYSLQIFNLTSYNTFL